MNIVLIGPPGCGKGTQSSIIADYFNLSRVVAGDIIRSFIKNSTQSEIAKRINEIVSLGKLIDSRLVFEMIKDFISNNNSKSGYLFDGYPRNIEQDSYFNKLITSDQKTLYINFLIDEKFLITRLCDRYQCTDCGTIYNKSLSPTKEHGQCDKCNSVNFIHRNDDEINVIQHRIKEFNKETIPLIEKYRQLNKDNFIEIDANRPVLEISKEISNFISKK